LASKFALPRFPQPLRRELADTRVRCSTSRQTTDTSLNSAAQVHAMNSAFAVRQSTALKRVAAQTIKALEKDLRECISAGP